MTIKPVATTSENTLTGYLQDDQFNISAGDLAIRKMRAMLSRSGPASRYNQLSIRARAAICYTAKLKPSLFASRDLDEMSPDEREAIRQAIIELKNIAAGFDGILDRIEFSRSHTVSVTHSEPVGHSDLNLQAKALFKQLSAPDQTLKI